MWLQLDGWRNAFNARIDRQSLRCGSTPHTLETVINGKWERNQFLPFTAMGLYFIISSLAAAAAAAIHVVYLRVPPAVRVIAEADHSMRKRTLHTDGAHPHSVPNVYCLFVSRRQFRFAFHFHSSRRAIHCVWLWTGSFFLSSVFSRFGRLWRQIADTISGKLISSFHCDNKCQLPHDVKPETSLIFGFGRTVPTAGITFKR